MNQTSEKTTDVLVSIDGGRTWTLHPDVPGGPAAAVRRVRDTNPDQLAAGSAVLYLTGGTVTQFQRQMVEQFDPVKLTLADARKIAAAVERVEAEEAEADRG